MYEVSTRAEGLGHRFLRVASHEYNIIRNRGRRGKGLCILRVASHEYSIIRLWKASHSDGSYYS